MLGLNISGFLSVLPIALYGMLGIFVVIFLIYLSIQLLLKLFPGD